jgi:hypothetical protein
MDRCREKPPPLYDLDEQGHQCACYLCEDGKKGDAPLVDGFSVLHPERVGLHAERED